MRKILAFPLVALSLALAVPAAAASAPSSTQAIVLPGATSAEGITLGRGSTFYAGDLFAGDIYRGDLRRGTAELFIDVPAGTMTVGMDVDVRHNLLFVAGFAGTARVYNASTGATVATYELGDPATSIINDVTVTPYGAWFNDSLQPKLYFVPIVFGVPGPARTLNLSGPAADFTGEFNINGMTSTPSGHTLLVAPAKLGKLCTINPFTGASAVVKGVTVPNADGLVLEGRRLWAVQTFQQNKISKWQLSADFSSGKSTGEITDPAFRIPLTAAKFGDKLAVVNSHYDTGVPPNHPTYEVLIVDA